MKLKLREICDHINLTRRCLPVAVGGCKLRILKRANEKFAQSHLLRILRGYGGRGDLAAFVYLHDHFRRAIVRQIDRCVTLGFLKRSAQSADQLRLNVIGQFADTVALGTCERNYDHRLSTLVQEKDRAREINRSRCSIDSRRRETAPIERRLHRLFKCILIPHQCESSFDAALLRNITVKLDGGFRLCRHLFRKMNVACEWSSVASYN